MTLRDIKKICLVTIAGFLTAVIIYPFLHETGHSLAALIVGAKVEEFHLLPIPNVLCNIKDINTAGIIMIGISGMLLPYIIALLPSPKNFLLWVMSFILRVTVLLSLLITLFAIWKFDAGSPLKNEDITQVLSLCPKGLNWFLGIFAILFAIMFLRTIPENIKLRVEHYFELA